MSMYDEVLFDDALPNIPSGGREFQTKSLERLLDRYLVTRDGRLCRIGTALREDEPITAAAQHPEECIDMDFHGDLQLVSDEGEYGEYTARFTHGTLEWVRQNDPANPGRFLAPDE